MILNECSLLTPMVCPPPKTFNSKSHFSASCHGIPSLPFRVSNHSIRSSRRPCQDLKLHSSIGKTPLRHLAVASPPRSICTEARFSRSTIPSTCKPKQRFFLVPPRASIEMPWSIRYPASKGENVKWWWRTLACIPYLISLRDTWKYAEAAYRLYPSLEKFEFVTSGFYRAFDRLPRWFVMVYFMAAYLGVVRRKEFHHFLRFNFVMSMLLENAIQIMETVCGLFPFAFYGGRIGYQHFWIALGVVYVLTVFVCMVHAIIGAYVEIPVVSEAAFIHSKI